MASEANSEKLNKLEDIVTQALKESYNEGAIIGLKFMQTGINDFCLAYRRLPKEAFIKNLRSYIQGIIDMQEFIIKKEKT